MQNYCDFLVCKEYEIEKSLTDNNTYTATIQADAESKYADYNLKAEVTYILYDQGWRFEIKEGNII